MPLSMELVVLAFQTWKDNQKEKGEIRFSELYYVEVNEIIIFWLRRIK